MKRTIFYYQTVGLFNDMPLTIQETKLLIAAVTKVSSNNNTAYLDIGNDEVCRAWVHPASATGNKNEIGRLQWGKTRKSGLPQIEGQGNFRPIQINQQQGEGINDLSHIVFFKNSVVGFEFNFYGPRVTKLSSYINSKTNFEIKLIPIIHPDAIGKLSKLKSISKFELKVKSNQLAAVDLGQKNFNTAVSELEKFTGCTDVSITVSIDPRNQDGLTTRITQFARNLIPEDSEDTTIKKIKIHGIDPDTEKISEIDLLQEYIISKQEIVALNSQLRVVDPKSAFSAISSGYEDNLSYIKKALGIE